VESSRGRLATRTSTAVRSGAAALAVLASLLLSGCGTGFDATAVQPYAPSDGVEGNSGDIRVVNALVVAGSTVSSGVISASVVNRGTRADALTGITSPDGKVSFTGSGTLAPGLSTVLGAGTDPAATITDLRRLAGETITLRLTFRRAEPLTLHTVVVEASGPYASVTAAPSPSAS